MVVEGQRIPARQADFIPGLTAQGAAAAGKLAEY
jgi:hypothetical protein